MSVPHQSCREEKDCSSRELTAYTLRSLITLLVLTGSVLIGFTLWAFMKDYSIKVCLISAFAGALSAVLPLTYFLLQGFFISKLTHASSIVLRLIVGTVFKYVLMGMLILICVKYLPLSRHIYFGAFFIIVILHQILAWRALKRF